MVDDKGRRRDVERLLRTLAKFLYEISSVTGTSELLLARLG